MASRVQQGFGIMACYTFESNEGGRAIPLQYPLE
jgi:hypothetical protein